MGTLSFAGIWQELINRRCHSVRTSKLRPAVCVLGAVCFLASVFIDSEAEAGALEARQHSSQEILIDHGDARPNRAQIASSIEQPLPDPLLNLDPPVFSVAADGEPVPQQDAGPSAHNRDSPAEASMSFDEFIKFIQDHKISLAFNVNCFISPVETVPRQLADIFSRPPNAFANSNDPRGHAK